jgi:hypothetical protein
MGIKEGCIILAFFGVLALANVAEQWEKNRVSAEYEVWMLKQTLHLDDNQVTKIARINRNYYDNMLGAYYSQYRDDQSYCKEIDRILTIRNREISNTLNENQQHLWNSLLQKR